jgi:1-aminocyclopropane-1-carboxylate deaminase/D-cysteine desulfhydrase-like pyridoxal-dependent ACC family enzyme
MALNLPDRFPRHNLMFGPSPVHRLDRLSRELGLDIWAKRDDFFAVTRGSNQPSLLTRNEIDAIPPTQSNPVSRIAPAKPSFRTPKQRRPA